MPRRKLVKDDSSERERFRQELAEVGRNLPDDAPGVEGADVGDVVRHRNGVEDDELRIARELANPHEDVETEIAKGIHLVDDEDDE